MELYQRIVRDLPPTPSKFHYIFNLRDLSRIYHGLSQTIPERFDTPGFFVRVWRNECLRVFYDRLTTDKDHTLVSDHISELLQQHFSGHVEVCVYSYVWMCFLEYTCTVSVPTYYRMSHKVCQRSLARMLIIIKKQKCQKTSVVLV